MRFTQCSKIKFFKHFAIRREKCIKSDNILHISLRTQTEILTKNYSVVLSKVAFLQAYRLLNSDNTADC